MQNVCCAYGRQAERQKGCKAVALKKEGIVKPLLANGCCLSVPGVDIDIVGQCEDFLFQSVDELLLTPSGKVGAPNGMVKQTVAAE